MPKISMLAAAWKLDESPFRHHVGRAILLTDLLLPKTVVSRDVQDESGGGEVVVAPGVSAQRNEGGTGPLGLRACNARLRRDTVKVYAGRSAR